MTLWRIVKTRLHGFVFPDLNITLCNRTVSGYSKNIFEMNCGIPICKFCQSIQEKYYKK